MRISCPSCDSSYSIPDDKLGPNGRTVKCARCGTTWLARPRLAEPAFETVAVDEKPIAAAKPAAPPPPPPPPPQADPFAAAEPGDDHEDLAAAARAAFGFGEAGDADADGATIEGLSSGMAKAAAEEVKKPDIESVAARTRRKFRTKGPRRWPQLKDRIGRSMGAISVLTAVLLVTVVLLQREAIVRAVPDLASLYAAFGMPVNLRGLAIEEVTTHRETENGQPVLVIEGKVVNVVSGARPVPTLRLALRGEDASEIYAWSVEPRAPELGPGETLKFRTRLAAPPDAAADVQIRFIDRRARQAGAP